MRGFMVESMVRTKIQDLLKNNMTDLCVKDIIMFYVCVTYLFFTFCNIYITNVFSYAWQLKINEHDDDA